MEIQKLRLYCDPHQSERETACEIYSVVRSSISSSNVTLKTLNGNDSNIYFLTSSVRFSCDTQDDERVRIHPVLLLTHCIIHVKPLRCGAVMQADNLSVFVHPQCPLNRTATVDEEDCNCVVGPPGQRGLPGPMVTNTHTEFTMMYVAFRCTNS